MADRPWLLLVAAPREVRAVLDALGSPDPVPEPWRAVETPRATVVRTGVGKWAAAGAAVQWYDAARHAGSLSLGVGGSLPGSGLDIAHAVLADPSLMGDEGVRTPDAFLSLGDIGFRDAGPVPPDPASRVALAPLVDRVGPVATVSACSGRDADAAELAARTAAVAEAMEGAAAALALRRLDPDARFAELRVISNNTGDRDRQVWDLDRALGRLSDLLGPALDALGD